MKNLFPICVGVFGAFLSACGGGGGSGGTSPPPPPAQITAPTGVTVSSEPLALIVSWNAVPNASQYNVYWSDTLDGIPQSASVQSTPETNFRIGNLYAGETYFVAVSARNGPLSSVHEATTPSTEPARVLGVEATPGDGQIALTWDSQPDADTFSVLLGESQNGPRTELTGATSPYVADGLTNGKYYYVSVAANNAEGQGADSQFLVVMPISTTAGWTGQVQVSDDIIGSIGVDISILDAAIGEDGTAAAIWDEDPSSVSTNRFLYVSHDSGGAWAEPLLLREDRGHGAVAVTPGGDVHVAFTSSDNTIETRRFSNGAWSAGSRIDSPELKVQTSFVQMKSDRQGNVFAAWVESSNVANQNGTRSFLKIWARRFDAVTESWGDAINVASPGWVIWPLTLDVGADNLAALAWTHNPNPFDPDGSDDNVLRTAHVSRFDGTTWQPATIVSRNDLMDSDDTRYVDVDVSPGGSVAALWTLELSSPGSADSFEVGFSRYDASLSQWSAPELITQQAQQSFFNPRVTIDDNLNSLVSWESNRFPRFGVSYFNPTTSIWSPRSFAPLQTDDRAEGFWVEDDENGNLFAFWQLESFPRPGAGLYFSRRDAASADWTPPQIVGGRLGVRKAFGHSPNGNVIYLSNSDLHYSSDLGIALFALKYIAP